MAKITVTAKLNTYHANEKIGPLIAGQQYEINETEFAPELFGYTGVIRIKPCPDAKYAYTINPTANLDDVSTNDNHYCGSGVTGGIRVCSDAVKPLNLKAIHCSNIFYCGQGIYLNMGL